MPKTRRNKGDETEDVDGDGANTNLQIEDNACWTRPGEGSNQHPHERFVSPTKLLHTLGTNSGSCQDIRPNICQESSIGEGDDIKEPDELASMLELQLEIEEAELRIKKRRLELLQCRSKISHVPLRESYESSYPSKQEVIGSTIRQGEPGSVPLLGFTLPRIEIESFDGSPDRFVEFMHSFNTIIADQVNETDKRLLYLIYYCKGPARDAIRHCSMLPKETCFDTAMRILREHFGMPHQVIHTVTKDIYDGPYLRAGDLASLQSLLRQMNNCNIVLSNLGLQADLDCSTNLLRIVRRLPKSLQIKWAERADSINCNGKAPKFVDMIEFLSKNISVINSEYGRVAFEHTKTLEGAVTKRNYRVASTQLAYTTRLCIICKSEHSLENCDQFIDMDVVARWRLLRNHKCCFICLKVGHRSKDCRSKGICTTSGCNKPHHQLLHETTAGVGRTYNTHACSTYGIGDTGVQLGFVPVRLSGPDGYLDTYAFLDNGSDCTLMSKWAAKGIGLHQTPDVVSINTLHGTSSVSCSKGVVQLRSIDDKFSTSVNPVLVVDSLPVDRANTHLKINGLRHLKDINITSLQDDRVGILIGCDVPEVHTSLDQRSGKRGEPFASKSPLGWVIRGPSREQSAANLQVNAIRSDDVCELLTRLYDTEFHDLSNPEMPHNSIEDNQALKIVESSVSFIDGQYQLAVPWKYDECALSDNRTVAVRRLTSLKRRLLKDDLLKVRYTQTMRDHISKGHVSLVQTIGHRWYLPHHPVINPKKPEKLRIVFDCAATFKDMSLNKALLQGPDWTTKLIGVLVRFRQYPVAVSADIKEMFLQVKLSDADRWAFSFLWWSSDDFEKPPVVYEWNVHPFGTISSPFCANYALRRTITEFSEKTKNLQAVHRNFYVDDYLASFKSVEEAKSTVMNLRSLLLKGHFELVKWVSNYSAALHILPRAACAPSRSDQELTDHGTRTLGITWRVQEDCFTFDIAQPEEPFTRRSILAYIASVYDPLGLVAPVVLTGKSILQELCRNKINWDEDLDRATEQKWQKWVVNVQLLGKVRIPRCITPILDHVIKTELHMFSDASERGYGVASYLRSICSNGNIYCHLVFGKARVAPLKAITIPRLELVSALLAAKVSSQIIEDLEVKIDDVRLWTDSEIVLHYISNTSTRYATFVANRLQRIRELTSVDQWHYVPTQYNPADMASRGIDANSPSFSIWLFGPEWLSQPDDDWPYFDCRIKVAVQSLELKHTVMAINISEPHSWLMEYAMRCSSWLRLLRSLVWLTRFKIYIMLKLKSRTDISLPIGTIKMDEMDQATLDVTRMSQDVHLTRKCCTSNSGQPDLRRLRPVQIQGVLYLTGRTCLVDAKQLLILPYKGPVTDLVVRHYHEISGHMGSTYVLAAIRRRFWIIKGMSAVRRNLSNCSKCRIQCAPTCEQVMAPLPLPRVQMGTYPFRFCGIDYFGPFLVMSGRKQLKRFGCLFTCLQTRAIHIEVAHDLSSDSFIMALLRFISRRGSPETIYSDNGTNFVGAELELKRLITSFEQRRISNELQAHSIDWVFNPPYSSHRGGVWERMIRTIRKVLNFMISEQPASDEVLLTSLAEVERIVNDRPLIPVYDDPNQPKALRPNDLLLMKPNPGLCNDEIPLRERYTRHWRQAQHLANLFWKRWYREYFPTLKLTQKWQVSHIDLKPGDLVLIQKPNAPRGIWPKGVVVKTFPGSDGKVRQVIVRTTQGEIRRDIRSLCFLEGAHD